MQFVDLVPRTRVHWDQHMNVTGKDSTPKGTLFLYSIVNHIDNMQTSFCRRARLQRILDIYLSEQENPDGSLKFEDRTMLNNRLNS